MEWAYKYNNERRWSTKLRLLRFFFFHFSRSLIKSYNFNTLTVVLVLRETMQWKEASVVRMID